MTLHVVYDHQCGKCGALYIPYDADVPCPRCGSIEKERFDFIEPAAESLRYNKRVGSYRPAAWGVSSLGDHVLSIMFDLFVDHEKMHPENFAVFAAKWLSLQDWGDQPYFQGHFLGIALRLYEALQAPEK
jgi:DNA-directed RNA polymerase subunit RPC12/RpoP